MKNDDAMMFGASDSILVIGAGRSGLASAKVLRERAISVVAYDDNEPDALEAQRAALAALGVPLIGRAELERAAAAATAAVLSPGVPLNNHAVLAVQRRNVPVYSEIELAFWLCPAPIVAVTGSKGKSTTTALVGHCLRQAGYSVRVGGNIGNPLILETAAAQAGDWVVAEVSSFQLESIRRFRPRISVLLNVTPDHLDRYPSMEEYAEAKYRIFANQQDGDAFIGNADDPYCARLRAGARTIPCRAYWFSALGADGAAVVLEDEAIVRTAASGGRRAILARPGDLKLRGRHNFENAMAAALTALLAGAPLTAVRAGLRTFEPLAHRLSPVALRGGVQWIDDSKATNPDAVVRALESFEEPIILIAGGRNKNTDFSELGAVASRRAKAAVLIGEAAQEIGAALQGIPVRYADSMDEAVRVAGSMAVAGDVVLLSPACASFDMFESAEQRGDVFAELARERAAGAAAG